ncbi:MAG: methyltransferase domain-containing protein [Acidobacteriota bacterium]
MAGGSESVSRLWRRRRSRLHRLLEPPSLVYHNPAERIIERNYCLGRWNLYIGGGGVRIPGFVNVDLFPLFGVDVVCSAEHLPFRNDLFRWVECDAVLEHVEDAEAVVSEIERCLEVGGLVHLVVPFCHPFHEYPRDFRRLTLDGLRQFCGGGLHCVSSGWRTGPAATWIAFTLEFVKAWSEARWWRGLVHFLLGWLLFPVRYVDAVLIARPSADRLGNHAFIYAVKAGSETASSD